MGGRAGMWVESSQRRRRCSIALSVVSARHDASPATSLRRQRREAKRLNLAAPLSGTVTGIEMALFDFPCVGSKYDHFLLESQRRSARTPVVSVNRPKADQEEQQERAANVACVALGVARRQSLAIRCSPREMDNTKLSCCPSYGRGTDDRSRNVASADCGSASSGTAELGRNDFSRQAEFIQDETRPRLRFRSSFRIV